MADNLGAWWVKCILKKWIKQWNNQLAVLEVY